MLALPSLAAGGGMSLAPSSSATSRAGDIGAFNFSPKAGNTAVIVIAAAVAVIFLLKR